jgi:KDO2-lipid IV(A) lauroyltransferase
LSYKTQSPIIVATTRREKGKYYIHYSDPIWPKAQAVLEEEGRRLMDLSLTALQESIRQNPGQWLWQHNRWKQQTPHLLLKAFRHDAVAIILPEEKKDFEKVLKSLPLLKKLYSRDFLFLFVPDKYKNYGLIEVDEVFFYQDLKETLRKDYRFKLVFNFTSSSSIKKHYKKLSAFSVLSIKDLQNIAKKNELELASLENISKVLIFSLCRKSFFEKLQQELQQEA